MNTPDLTPYARNNFSPSPKPAEAFVHQGLFRTVGAPSPSPSPQNSRTPRDKPVFTLLHKAEELEAEIDPTPVLKGPGLLWLVPSQLAAQRRWQPDRCRRGQGKKMRLR